MIFTLLRIVAVLKRIAKELQRSSEIAEKLLALKAPAPVKSRPFQMGSASAERWNEKAERRKEGLER
jgi:hypothetical protein